MASPVLFYTIPCNEQQPLRLLFYGKSWLLLCLVLHCTHTMSSSLDGCCFLVNSHHCHTLPCTVPYNEEQPQWLLHCDKSLLLPLSSHLVPYCTMSSSCWGCYIMSSSCCHCTVLCLFPYCTSPHLHHALHISVLQDKSSPLPHLAYLYIT